MSVDLVSAFHAVERAVHGSENPRTGWAALVAAIDHTGYPVAESLRSTDFTAEVEVVRRQVSRTFAGEPPPAELTAFYFGLFTSWDPKTETEGAGFYVSGTTSPNPEDALSGDLAYWPAQRYLDSALLDGIQNAHATGTPAFRVYDYAFVLDAAALLAKHAVREFAGNRPVFVGFDSGDYLRVWPAAPDV
jgi:hypothetical protein